MSQASDVHKRKAKTRPSKLFDAETSNLRDVVSRFIVWHKTLDTSYSVLNNFDTFYFLCKLWESGDYRAHARYIDILHRLGLVRFSRVNRVSRVNGLV